MHIQAVSRTDVGNKRSINEDCVYSPNDSFVWVVADGMGGHSAGDIASKIICDTFAYYASNTPAPPTLFNLAEFALHCIEHANSEVRKHMKKELLGTMGSTVAAITISNGFGLVSWVGDSRAYSYRNGTLTCLTQDHSFVQELLKAGEITDDEVKNHPARNIITRAVGVDDSITADLQVFVPEVGDVYLLCSDGLYNTATDLGTTFAKLSDNLNLDDMANQLMDIALAEEADDNVSFILLRVSA